VPLKNAYSEEIPLAALLVNVDTRNAKVSLTEMMLLIVIMSASLGDTVDLQKLSCNFLYSR